METQSDDRFEVLIDGELVGEIHFGSNSRFAAFPADGGAPHDGFYDAEHARCWLERRKWLIDHVRRNSRRG